MDQKDSGGGRGQFSCPFWPFPLGDITLLSRLLAVHFGGGEWDTRLLLVRIVSDVMRSLLGVGGARGEQF